MTVAQEIDIDYLASLERALIPSRWRQAAVGAAEKLGIEPHGVRMGALDVADQGIDRNAFAGRYGNVLQVLESWSGKGSDIFESVARAFALCDEHGFDRFSYDSVGVGSGTRGDARALNEARERDGRPPIHADAYCGSAAVEDATGELVPGRENSDMFANTKAMSWWALRIRFQNTYRAVVEKRGDVDLENIISLDPAIAELPQLLAELGQVTYGINAAGRIVIDKTPDGQPSPNLADAVCMCFAPSSTSEALNVWARFGAAIMA